MKILENLVDIGKVVVEKFVAIKPAVKWEFVETIFYANREKCSKASALEGWRVFVSFDSEFQFKMLGKDRCT